VKLHFPYGQPGENQDVLWRCEAKRYSVVIDPDAEIYGVSDPRLELHYYGVIRRTEKGAYIHGPGHLTRHQASSEHLVRLWANKAYARNTVDEAVKDFAARRKRQIQILERQLSRAQEELALTEKGGLLA
jgi:hypothetical protein